MKCAPSFHVQSSELLYIFLIVCIGTSDKAKAQGLKKSQELNSIVSTFFLRRTLRDLTTDHLPPKFEYVIFARLSAAQRQLYEDCLAYQKAINLKKASSPNKTFENNLFVFRMIESLREICQHPQLFNKNRIHKESDVPMPPLMAQGLSPENSGKMAVLHGLLSIIYRDTTDRVVIVAGSLNALNALEKLCEKECWGHLRLDGSTPLADRGVILQMFSAESNNKGERSNTRQVSEPFILLLSVKAGGQGLNLVSANRLVLWDR